MDALRWTTRVYIGSLMGAALGGTAVAFTRTTRIDTAELVLAVVIAGCMTLAWLFPIHIAARTKLYVDAAVTIAAVLLLQPALALASVGSGTLVAQLGRRDDRDWAQALFNTAQTMLGALVAALLLAAVGGDPRRPAYAEVWFLPVLLTAAVVMYLLNAFLVATVTALQEAIPVVPTFRLALGEDLRGEVIAHIALVTIGTIAAMVANVYPGALILFVVPVAAIHTTMHQQARMRQEAERARMMSDAALAAAQRQARLGSWEWIPATDRWSWSDEGHRLLGLDIGATASTTNIFLNTVHPEDRARVADVLQAARRTPTPFVLDHRVSLPDGCDRVVHHRAEFHADGAGASRFLGMIQDITERVQAEIALRQAKETAEEADRAKTQLLSMASHDLRTPITAIQGYLELVTDGSLGELNEDQREFLEVAHRNTRQLARLVTDLLDLARIEAGRFPLQHRAVDVNGALAEALELVAPQAAKKQIQLDLVVAPCAPVICADPDRLDQVLLNVVDNAVKFTDRGTVSMSTAVEGSQVVITVADTGCGIAPTALPHIFEAFNQAGEVAKRSGGSGLGLTIVQQLVELHEGEISVESELGVGTSVSIRFPATSHAPGADGVCSSPMPT